MSSTTSGILFDLDGTLLDTAPEFTHCLNCILTESNRSPVNVNDLRRHVSFGVKGMLNFGFQNVLSNDDLLTHTERFLTLYRDQLGALTQPFPGIEELLSWITAQNIPWGIVTNKAKRFAEPLLQQFPLMHNSACLISGDTLPVCKPDPAPLLAACAQLKLNPAHTWYVGDALADLQASHSAGLKCAIAQYGYIPYHEDALSWKADHHFNHPRELMELLG